MARSGHSPHSGVRLRRAPARKWRSVKRLGGAGDGDRTRDIQLGKLTPWLPGMSASDRL